MSVSLDTEFRRDRLVLWLVAVFLLLVFLYVAWQYVGAVMLGLFAYYVTRPVFDRIYGRVGNRMLAVAVSLFAVALPVLLLTGWTAAIAIQGLLDLLSTTGFEDLAEMVEPYVDLSTLQADLVATAEQIADDPQQITAIGGNGVGNVFATPGTTPAKYASVRRRDRTNAADASVGTGRRRGSARKFIL